LNVIVIDIADEPRPWNNLTIKFPQRNSLGDYWRRFYTIRRIGLYDIGALWLVCWHTLTYLLTHLQPVAIVVELCLVSRCNFRGGTRSRSSLGGFSLRGATTRQNPTLRRSMLVQISATERTRIV